MRSIRHHMKGIAGEQALGFSPVHAQPQITADDHCVGIKRMGVYIKFGIRLPATLGDLIIASSEHDRTKLLKGEIDRFHNGPFGLKLRIGLA